VEEKAKSTLQWSSMPEWGWRWAEGFTGYLEMAKGNKRFNLCEIGAD